MQACHDAFPIPGYILDFKFLFERWKNASPAVSFAEFREIWKEMEFSYIHGAKPDVYQQEQWTQILYEAALGYMWVNDYRVKLGSLYALYLLFETQPKIGKQKINVSIHIWKELLSIILSEGRPIDSYAIMVNLTNKKAFCLHASVDIIPPPSSATKVPTKLQHGKMGAQFGIENTFDTVSDAINLEAIEKADQAARLHHTSSTSILSADLIQDLKDIKNNVGLHVGLMPDVS